MPPAKTSDPARGTVPVRSSLACAALALSIAIPSSAAAAAGGVGRVTGLPIPRFASVKARPANVRVGPGVDYPLKWTFVRRYAPVEITAEFGQWRRIRDWDGSSGWLLGALLSGRRTALAAPSQHGSTVPVRSEPAAKARVIVRLQPKVFLRLRSCDGHWCRVSVHGAGGFVRQSRLWGVYPGEAL